jgi:hypothetical protein
MTKKTYEDPTLFDGADYVTQELLWEDWNNEVTVGAIKESLKNLKDEYFIHQYNDWVEDGCERQFLQASFYVVRPATEEEISECKRELEKMLKAQPVKESVTDLVNKLNKALKEEGIKGSVTICGKEIGISVPVVEKVVEEPKVIRAIADLNTVLKLEKLTIEEPKVAVGFANLDTITKLELPLAPQENKSLLPKEEKVTLDEKYDYMRRLGSAFDMGNVYQDQYIKLLKEREEQEKSLKTK